ncbi:MAG: hypothetical protein IH988_10720, partial [Planctomycetes bacterium]|nr:hypothetical protein [Planctomycetota bacterium]
VDSEGCSRNLQEGVLRAAFRESASDPSPVSPGEPYEYRIDLGPVSALGAGVLVRRHDSSLCGVSTRRGQLPNVSNG